MRTVCLTPVAQSVQCLLLLCGLLIYCTPAFAARGDSSLVADEKPRGVVCVPDQAGQGWDCREDHGQRPTAEQIRSFADQTDTPVAPVPIDDKVDTLTGLSSDPQDWYVEATPKPTATSHIVDGDLAARIYQDELPDAPGTDTCEGGYVVREYPLPVDADNREYPLEAHADGLTATLNQQAILRGNVTVEQGNLRLIAPSAILDQQSRVATFAEGVILDQPGIIMQGGRAEVNTQSKDAALEDVQFVLIAPNIRGEAAAMSQNGAGDLTLEKNNFTRCEPGNSGWRLNAKSLVIEKDAVFGTARHAVLRMKKVPVFYTPYLKFPISDERVSGFLFPNISHSDEDGIDVSVPYYLNLAPNYDATIVPRVVGERGVGLETEFRHMSSWQNTTIAAGILPEDKLFNGTLDRGDFKELGGEAVLGKFEPADRWLGAVDHRGYFGNFRSVIDYTAASDREYFRDLGSDLGLSSRRALERRGEIQYAQGGFFARLWAQRFQRLDEITVEEYRRLPELDLSYSGRLAGPVEFDLGAKFSDFDRDTEGLNGIAAVTGRRMHLEPKLRVPFSWPFGFVRFGGGYRHTQYDLEQDRNAGGAPLIDDNPDRNIGFGYVDGGLFFERDSKLFNQDLIQTLEPRVYYLWQEFDEQSNLPKFDATNLTFSYNQLYRNNRFSGLDRIGDANQVSAGVTTRFISRASGQEYFRASVGEIFYFEDRQVTLSDSPTPTELQSSSALAGEVAASIGGSWRVFGNVIWDPHDNEVDEGGGGIGYRRDNRHIFNIGFRNRREGDIEQSDISLYWPLTKRLAILGRWNYDLVSGRTIEGFGGLEYSDCCLQVRLVARRFLDSRSNDFSEVEGDDGIFLQIVFKGLAGFGTKVESVLERGIRGYRSPTQGDYFFQLGADCQVHMKRIVRMTVLKNLTRAAKAGLLSMLLTAGMSAAPTWAEYQELDAIAAVVEDDVVLASELRTRYQQIVKTMKGQNAQLPPDDVLISQIMERLIVESLQKQEAERRGVTIDDETLTRAMMSFAQNNNMNLDEFRQALARDGLSYREFREEIRTEMMISRLQRNLINRRISISDQDLQGLLNSPFYQQLFSDEYRVGHILISLDERATDEVAAAALAKAQGIVAELRNGADFAQMAIENSSSSRALEGGDLGWRKAAELPSLFAEAVLDMQDGEIGAPIQTAGAVHIIKLLERRGAGTQSEQQTLVRHILVRPSEIRSPEETAELIQSVHRKLEGGGDFEELAKEYSEDPASALAGGELGWSTPGQFVGQFGTVMDSTAQGDVSEPFLTQFGWHILQVLDRREEDMSDEARENMALEILHKRRFEEEQQEWLKELRDEAFVEIRL